MRKNRKLHRICNLIKKSGYFDPQFYLKEYPDVKEAGVDPAEHYLIYGGFEGRNPSVSFNTEYYIESYPDVVESKMNPLLHYILHGTKENRSVLPVEVNNDKGDGNESEKEYNNTYNLLYKEHYNEIKEIERSGFFNEALYEFISPDVLDANIDLVLHYIIHGRNEGRNDAMFSLEGIKYKVHQEQLIAQGYINGNLKADATKPKVLLCAHLVSKTNAGAENSFLDLVNAFKRIKTGCVVCLPGYDEPYINKLIPDVDKIFIINYKLWNEVRHSNLIVDKLESVILSEKIDLVYVNTITIREPLVAARNNNIPGIVHVREMILGDEYIVESIGLKKEEIKQRILSSCDFIVANSALVGRYFNLKGKTFVLPNTIEIEDFDIPNSLNNDDKVRVGLISSNIPKKGIYDFFEVARLCQKHTDKAEFLLIGPQRDFIEEIPRGNQVGEIPSNVKFLTDINDPVEAVSQTNIVINLSLFSESFGRTILEGMAAGRPVIAYDFGALSDLVENGINGYLVTYRDVEAVAERINSLVNDIDLLQRLGSKGREIAREKYSREVYAKKTGDILQKVLSIWDGKAEKVLKNEFSTERYIRLGQSQTSVIIPCGNINDLQIKGLNGIINQSLTPAEIILLVDTPDDSKLSVIENYLSNADIPLIIINTEDSAGKYDQWIKGINEATGNYVWIAETDGLSSTDLLYALQNRIINERSLLAYYQYEKTDSKERGNQVDSLYPVSEPDVFKWKENNKKIGLENIADYLFVNDMIPDISNCLFKRSTLSDVSGDIGRFKYLGELYLFIRLLSKGTFSYLPKTITTSLDNKNIINDPQLKFPDCLYELDEIKNHIADNHPVDLEQLERMKQFLNHITVSKYGKLKPDDLTNARETTSAYMHYEGQDDIRLHIDNSDLLKNSIQVNGWTFSKNGIKEIEVYLNDVFLGKARTGLSRPDLKKAFPDINDIDKSGFSFLKIISSINVTSGNENDILLIRVTDNSGNKKILKRKVYPAGSEVSYIGRADKINLHEDIKLLTNKTDVKQIDTSISVVIPTKNAGSEFDNLLRTLSGQIGFREIELVIVDSGSTDDTLMVAERYGANIVKIKPEEFTHSYSRNLGAERAKNDYLFFTVQDAIPSSLYLFYQLYTRLKKTGLKVITCTETPRSGCDLFFRVTNRNHYQFLDVINKDKLFKYPGTDDYVQLRKNAQLSDIGLFIDRELFMQYKYRLDYGEDLDLGMRLVKDGHILYYAGTVKMIHSHNRPPFYYLRRGLVDSIYMKIRFESFKYPDTRLEEVVMEIPALFNEIVLLIENKLLKTDHSDTFNSIDCTEELEIIHDKPPERTGKLLDSELVDEETYQFISQINDMAERIGSLKATKKNITRGVINYSYKLNNYLLDHYSSFSKETIRDYANALMRIFTMFTGAYLGYCFLNAPEDQHAKKISDELRKNV